MSLMTEKREEEAAEAKASKEDDDRKGVQMHTTCNKNNIMMMKNVCAPA